MTMDGPAAKNYSTTGAHRGFRAIDKMSNVRPVGSHLGEFLGDEMAALLASRDNLHK
jgi:hypothetical protein